MNPAAIPLVRGLQSLHLGMLLAVPLLWPAMVLAATYSATPSTFAALLSRLGPGDTLELQSGTYPPLSYHQFRFPSGTSWANAPRIVAASGAQVRTPRIQLRHVGYLHVSGIDVTCGEGSLEGVYLGAGTHHIRVQHGEVSGCQQQGILVPKESGGHHEFLHLNVHHNGTRDHFHHGIYIAAAHNLVAYSQVHHNRGYGIHIYSRHETTAYHNIVRDNQVYANGRFGIILSNGIRNQAIGNRVHGNAWGAIAVDDSAPCAILRDNQTEGRIERRDRPQSDCPAGTDLALPAPPAPPAPRNLRLLSP